MSETSPKPPTEVLRGNMGVELAIWVKEVEYESRTIAQVSGRLQRRYLDKQGKWQSTFYLSPVEWLVAGALYQEAYTRYKLSPNGDAQPETPFSADS